VIDRARRLGYCSPDTPTFDELCDTAEDELYSAKPFNCRTMYTIQYNIRVLEAVRTQRTARTITTIIHCLTTP